MQRFSRLHHFSRPSLLGSYQTTRSFSYTPHGGKLINCVLPKNSERYNELWGTLDDLPNIVLTKRNICDLELIMNGAFSPLDGFMTQANYDRVVEEMRLTDGTLWSMPINLDINNDQATLIEQSGKDQVVLRDAEGNPLAIMDVKDLWTPNKQREAELVFGGDPEHPAIDYLNKYTKDLYIGGKLYGFQLPPWYDYKDIRKTPAQVREMFEKKGWDSVAAFQTRNPMHRAHFELTLQALDMSPDMKLLIHPVVGMTKPGDIDHHTRVKCYKEIMPKYPKDRAELVVFPLAMRMGGPREAIWHAIIRKNYGATHFILGRDHAGPGSNSAGKDFYGPFDARDAAVANADEIGINCLSFEMVVYGKETQKFYAASKVPSDVTPLKLSGTEVRRRLVTGEEIPEWFSFPSVVKILRQAHPPHHRQGCVLFFTGLSGSGKTTVANALMERLMELQERRVTILDGDHVRQLISSELGFSHEHRNLNIKRIGFIASLISNSGGLVLAAPIAPYESSRDFAKQTCKEVGGYCEIYISTSVDECSRRDRKGLYEKAKKGDIKLTGVNDPYEAPQNPDLNIDTERVSVEDAVEMVLDWMKEKGYLLREEEAKLL